MNETGKSSGPGAGQASRRPGEASLGPAGTVTRLTLGMPHEDEGDGADTSAEEKRPGRGKGGRGGKGQRNAPVIEVRPVAEPARMRRRHRGVLFSFVLLVLLPSLAGIAYLWLYARDQYASTVGFTVRQEENANTAGLIGGLAQFVGGTSGSDGDILYEFIQSQEIVEAIDARIDLRTKFSVNWPADPVFALWPDASIEDLVWFWQRMVRISYDQSSGLTEMRTLAFTPQDARLIADEILAESQRMINELNATARADVMRYALADLDTSVARLKSAREALTAFRAKTQIVDPAADVQGRMGVLNNLQQQLAQQLVDYDLLLENTHSGDPRLLQAERRIAVIRDRISEERSNLASNGEGADEDGTDYPALLAEFEGLTVDREFAEQTYRAALAAVDVARANASRNSRYLATYIRPTVPQTSEYPQRLMLSGLLVLFLFMAWAILVLVYYSIRDRR